MKVICVNIMNDESSFSDRVLGLSLFTFYSVVVEYNKWYEIVNDDGYKTFYDKKRFLTMAEWRDKQIDLILKD